MNKLEPTYTDLFLLSDCSGSMGQRVYDKNNQELKNSEGHNLQLYEVAQKSFNKMIMEQAKSKDFCLFSFAQFDDYYHPNRLGEPIQDTKLITQCKAAGGTSMYSGILVALNELQENINNREVPPHQINFMVFTDGGTGECDMEECIDLVEDLQKKYELNILLIAPYQPNDIMDNLKQDRGNGLYLKDMTDFSLENGVKACMERIENLKRRSFGLTASNDSVQKLYNVRKDS